MVNISTINNTNMNNPNNITQSNNYNNIGNNNDNTPTNKLSHMGHNYVQGRYSILSPLSPKAGSTKYITTPQTNTTHH
jgi:hypothetical protein